MRCHFRHNHGAGLRTLLAFLLHEADLRPYLQLVEVSAEHAIAMEINLAVVGGFDNAVVEFGFEASNAAERCSFVHLYRAAQFPNVVFQLPTRGIECFTDRLRQLLFGLAIYS